MTLVTDLWAGVLQLARLAAATNHRARTRGLWDAGLTLQITLDMHQLQKDGNTGCVRQAVCNGASAFFCQLP